MISKILQQFICFECFFDIQYDTDSVGQVYPDVYDEFEKEEEPSKKKKGKSKRKTGKKKNKIYEKTTLYKVCTSLPMS